MAVKGLGGFHLACNAADRATVLRLRRLKHRPFKPFAVMCRDIETAAGHCKISPAESELLKSPAAPIVLLAKRPDSSLPPELAPGLDTLGVMLPYTPLHLLLMQEGPPVLVLTSGNRGGMPIVIDNRQALDELGDVADYFIMHDREIVNRCDDSVTMVIGGGLQLLRRSRGFVPEPLKVPVPAGMRVVLGMGGDMKNAFCLLNGDKAFMSQHIGEMDTLEGVKSFKRALESLCRLTGIEPEVIACDLHPGYASSRLAGDLAKKLGMLRHGGVQHHHAHMASCMAENALDGDVIGVILDGTGYGLDGKIWGFEIMWGGYGGFHRGYHLDYVPLPGGDRAVRNPWLTAAAYLMTFLGYGALDAARLFPEYRRELETAEKMLSAKLNSPPASSCGRFFDAVAALLGVCRENTYEGQAAVALGSLAPWFPSEQGLPHLSAELEPYPFDFRGDVIDPSAVLSHIIEDIHGKTPARIIVKRFHDTIIAIVADAVRKVRAKTGISRVVLSGGTWHNRYLSGMAKIVLEQNGFEVFAHRHVPPGDGGIALGQAAAAAVQFVKRPGAPALCRGSK